MTTIRDTTISPEMPAGCKPKLAGEKACKKIPLTTENPLISPSVVLYLYKTGPVGQVVKTSPSHGGNRGSTPLRDTNERIARNGDSFYISTYLQAFEQLICYLKKSRFVSK